MIKFNEEWLKKSISGALKLRTEINDIIDKIHQKGYRNICWMGIGGTWASALQVEVHMRELSAICCIVENAAEYLTSGNRQIGSGSIVIISSVSGNTEEIVKAVHKVKESGGKILGFIDNADSILAKEVDWCISYPENEQLKFFMAADRLMYLNEELADYEDIYQNFEQFLPDALVAVNQQADVFARQFALQHHNDSLHYFVGSGNQYGAVYSYAMCYWEEQHWIRSKSIHSAEFFHGMFEVVERDTNVTVYLGEDSQRALSERVAAFLPRICANYTIIDTKDYPLQGIKKEYRGYISHLVMRQVNSRIDVHIEKINCHPMEIRRYYRVLSY